MSIAINSNPQRDQLIATGGQTVFNYSFPIADETYLTVYQRASTDAPDDSTQKLFLGSDYSVTGVGEEEGGTIVLNVAAVANDIITIVGTEPIDRVSVFDDLNPLTIALNQQLNELTIMINQVYTYWNNITPHYNYDELIRGPLDEFDAGVRPFKRILPMLPNGHVWVGRGEIGEDPDDIITALLGDGTGNVVSTGSPMRKSIATWTGLGTQITDSFIDIDGATFIKTVDTTEETIGIDDDWGAFHWPAHVTGDRPVTANDGDTYYDTTLNQFYGYVNGSWVPFSTGSGDTSLIKMTFTQVAHGFVQGNYVYMRSDGMWDETDATTSVTAELQGLVSRRIDADNFELQTVGFVDISSWVGPPSWFTGMVAGDVFFLSDTNAGRHTLVPPTINGHVNLAPVFLAITPTLGQLRQSRGLIVGGQPPTSNPGSDTVFVNVTQTGHGFTKGDWLYCQAYDAGNGEVQYAKARSDVLTTSHTAGVVSTYIDADHFILQEGGYNSTGAVTTATNAPGSAIASGTVYYLSNTDAGKLMSSPPVTVGHYAVRCYESEQIAADNPPDSLDAGYILDKRPILITGPVVAGGDQLITTYTINNEQDIAFPGLFDGTYSDVKIVIRDLIMQLAGDPPTLFRGDQLAMQLEVGGIRRVDQNYKPMNAAGAGTNRFDVTFSTAGIYQYTFGGGCWEGDILINGITSNTLFKYVRTTQRYWQNLNTPTHPNAVWTQTSSSMQNDVYLGSTLEITGFYFFTNNANVTLVSGTISVYGTVS